MRFKTTAWLCIALLLGGLTYWLLHAREAQLAQRQEATLQALRLRPERVSWLLFHHDEIRIESQRENGQWQLVTPVRGRADTGKIDGLLTKLAAMMPGNLISREERQAEGLTLADYGLDRPRGRLVWREGIRETTVWIGRRAPLGDRLFIMHAGQEHVIAVPGDLVDMWPKDTDHLRDRLLFRGEPRRVNRIEIRRPDGFLQAHRNPDGTWRFTQPLAAPGDRAHIRQWLDRFFDARIVDFVSDQMADGTVYGLDESVVQLNLWLEEESESQTLRLGTITEISEDWAYAQRGGGQTVFTVPAALLHAARIDINNLRDQTLMPLQVREIDAITLQPTEGEYTRLARDPDAHWWIVHPRRWRADNARVERVLRAWTAARITRFIPPETPETHDAIADTAPTLTFQARLLADATEPTRPPRDREVALQFRFGPIQEQTHTLHLQRNQDPVRYEVGMELLDALSWDPLYYRDRAIWRIDRADVLSLTRSTPTATHTFQRNEQDEWQLDSASDTPAPELAPPHPSLQHILRILLQLDADAYIEESPASWQDFGLEEPTRTWTLHLRPEAGIARSLHLGAPLPDGRVYARTRGGDTLFLLDAATATLLLNDP